MADLQMIESLCSLCEELARLVRAMAERLGQLGDISLSDEIAAADARYRALLGTDEVPNNPGISPGPPSGGPGPCYKQGEDRV